MSNSTLHLVSSDLAVSKNEKAAGLSRQYFRPSEVAKVTGLARSTVFAALYSGQLRAFQMGRAWLIPVEAVPEWIEGRPSDSQQ